MFKWQISASLLIRHKDNIFVFLQDLYITEHLTSEPCQENNVPLFNPEEDLMDLVATEETRIETGSQVAKSIISSIFHRIEHKGKRRETEVPIENLIGGQ